MPSRTYVPMLRLLFEGVKKFIGRYRDRLQNNLSQFLFALADLICDLCIIFLAYIETASDIGGHYDPGITPPTSGYINQVQGAVAKFFDSLGIDPEEA